MNRLLITGFAYSGTTLLSLGLSRSPQVCALGEVPLASHRQAELPCTCGESFGSCAVWGPWFQPTQSRDLPALIRGFAEQLPRVERGVRWWVDSGKTQHGGLTDHLAAEHGELKILHLVRHPAAVAYSCLARGMTLEEAVDLWIDMETRALDELERSRRHGRTLRFENMVEDFGATLAELGEWLDVAGPFGERGAAWDYRAASWSGRVHMMASNTSIKFGGLPEQVAPDERYRHALGNKLVTRIEGQTRGVLERLEALSS